MLRRTLDQQAAGARRKGLVVDLADAPPITLLGDEGQLERVMANLLANAVKFTPGGGRVTVATRAENGCVEVAIQDTGRGIPAAELPYLFEKYRRVREAKRTEGTGLGLSIVKTIVEAHGGQIRVESAAGAGSTFIVCLPADAG
jgi:signal transduction histidine kinase